MSLEVSTIPVKYVFVSDTTPSDVTEGKIWIDTNTTPPITKVSDGTTYNALSTDLSVLEDQMIRQSIGILKLEANATLTTQDYTNIFLDVFSDANAYDNTVDTETTTATFQTNKYQNTIGASAETTAHGIAYASQDVDSGTHGLLITVNNACAITSVTKYTQCTGTRCTISNYATPSTLMGTATFSGDVATFTTPVALTVGQTYDIAVDNSGASYTRALSGASAYPYNDTNINITDNVYNAITTPSHAGDYAVSITSIATEDSSPANKIIQTNAITVTTAQTHHQVYCDNATAGTGTVTYDISFDNGSTWDTAQALNTKNTRAGTTGTQMIIKLNTNGIGSGNTSNVSNYGVMLWY